MAKQYAIVGSFSFQAKTGKGISSFTYDPETADMTRVCNLRDEATIGAHCSDSETDMIYATREEADIPGIKGGGGDTISFKLDRETGMLTQTGETSSLEPQPSYVRLDKSKKYVLTTNHGTNNVVTKVVRCPDGSFTNHIIADDGALILYRVNDDGSIGDICDVCIVPGNDKVVQYPHSARAVNGIPHLHSVMPDPTGELYVVCDKGVDKVYSFKIDRENGKIIHTDTIQCDRFTAPRYTAMHPTLPLFYENNEDSSDLIVFGYDVETGKLTEKLRVPVAEGDAAKGMSSDIAVSLDGKALYAAVRGSDVISVFLLDADGMPKLKESLPCGGEAPRGVCVTPDGRFFLVANTNSNNIAVFSICEDGSLADTGKRIDAPCPGNISIM